MEASHVLWTFAIYHTCPPGRALYLSGNITTLGSWNQQKSIKMDTKDKVNWSTRVELGLGQTVEYKYLEASQQNPTMEAVWQPGDNRKLTVAQPRQHLQIMTFNIRYDNPEDGQDRWDKRKEKLCRMLLNEKPCILGIQEAKLQQRQYMTEKLKGLYNYVGVARDLGSDEEVGIFYQGCKFQIIDSGFVWLSEDRCPGRPGFGCVLPRNLTYLVLRYRKTNNALVVINTHLDLSVFAQSQSIPIILQTALELQKKHNTCDVFLTGDFNANDQQQIFQPFYRHGFKSARHNCKTKDTLQNTFNAFHGWVATGIIKMFSKSLDSCAIIDHIFYSCQNYRLVNFRVPRPTGRHLSDHYAVIAQFTDSS